MRVRRKDTDLRWQRPAKDDAPVVDHAQRSESGAVERLERGRMRLGDIQRGVDPVASHDDSTAPASFLARRHATRAAKVAGAVPSEIARRAHGAREYDG